MTVDTVPAIATLRDFMLTNFGYLKFDREQRVSLGDLKDME
jgi:hypothetical protein